MFRLVITTARVASASWMATPKFINGWTAGPGSPSQGKTTFQQQEHLLRGIRTWSGYPNVRRYHNRDDLPAFIALGHKYDAAGLKHRLRTIKTTGVGYLN